MESKELRIHHRPLTPEQVEEFRKRWKSGEMPRDCKEVQDVPQAPPIRWEEEFSLCYYAYCGVNYVGFVLSDKGQFFPKFYCGDSDINTLPFPTLEAAKSAVESAWVEWWANLWEVV